MANISSTVDPNSRIRTSPHLDPNNITAIIRRLTPMDIECYAHGDDYNDGKVHTDVWYFGSVQGPRGYVWGGNVNTQQDPPPGLDLCP